MPLEHDVTGWLLGVIMAITAVLLVVGWNVRIAAALLVVAGPLGMLEFGFEPVLHRVDMLGLAVFLLIAGPGRWSADHELGRVREPTVYPDRRRDRGLVRVLVISGALPQLIVLIAGIPFNLTLYFFGTTELLGHLPVTARCSCCSSSAPTPCCASTARGCCRR